MSKGGVNVNVSKQAIPQPDSGNRLDAATAKGTVSYVPSSVGEVDHG